MTSCFLSCALITFKKGVYSKRNEFATKGSKFFPFREDPFSEDEKTIWKELPPSLEILSILLKYPINKESEINRKHELIT